MAPRGKRNTWCFRPFHEYENGLDLVCCCCIVLLECACVFEWKRVENTCEFLDHSIQGALAGDGEAAEPPDNHVLQNAIHDVSSGAP